MKLIVLMLNFFGQILLHDSADFPLTVKDCKWRGDQE